MSQSPGNPTHLPRLPRRKLPSRAPTPRPCPGSSDAFGLGVCGECFCVLAPRHSGFPPRAVSSRTPLGPRLSFRQRGPEAGAGDASGAGRLSEPRGGWRATGRAGPVVSGAHYRGRVVDVAVVRAYAAGRPGSGARDLRGGCGSRPFSNLIGLVVMWSAEASTITRGMFS